MAHKILAENHKGWLIQLSHKLLPNPYWIRKGKTISDRMKEIVKDIKEKQNEP